MWCSKFGHWIKLSCRICIGKKDLREVFLSLNISIPQFHWKGLQDFLKFNNLWDNVTWIWKNSQICACYENLSKVWSRNFSNGKSRHYFKLFFCSSTSNDGIVHFFSVIVWGSSYLFQQKIRFSLPFHKCVLTVFYVSYQACVCAAGDSAAYHRTSVFGDDVVIVA